MKNNLTYDSAFLALEKLVDQIENEDIKLDTLAKKVQEANDLILFCEKKLREIDKEVKMISGTTKPSVRKKNNS